MSRMHFLVLLASIVALSGTFAHKCIHDQLEKYEHTSLVHYVNHPFHVIQNIGSETYFELNRQFVENGEPMNWPNQLGLGYEIGAPENPEKDAFDAALLASGRAPSLEYLDSPIQNPAEEGIHTLSEMIPEKKGIDYYPVLSKFSNSKQKEQGMHVKNLANTFLSNERDVMASNSSQVKTWKKLRISFVTDKLSSTNVKNILPEVGELLSDLLYVYPVEGNLQLERHCSQHWLKNGEPYVPARCVSFQNLKCGNDYGDVPDYLYKSQPIYSPHISSLIVGYTAGGVGMNDTDIVIFVTDNFSQCSAGVIAYATSCSRDQYGRPIAGFVNVCMPNHGEIKMTLVHEIMHALGFSGDQYVNYRNPDGTKVENPVLTTYERGNTVYRLMVQPAVTIARQHFQCNTLPGVELENQGGSGTEGSHLERRVFHGEAMIGQIVTGAVVSPISAAVLESSGWYRADYSKTNRLAWGDKSGCDMAYAKKCLTASGPTADEFCMSGEEPYCTADYKAKGTCKIYIYNDPLPTQFQYFSNSKYGGSSLMDYCPYYEPTTYCTQSSSTTSGETFGTSSRCFLKSLSDSDPNVQSGTPGCYNVQCTVNNNEVQSIEVFVGNTSVVCEKGDEGEVKTVSGYYGLIMCPKNYNIMCDIKPMANYNVTQTGCRFECRNGVCQDGKCVCDAGFTGDICEISSAFQATLSLAALIVCALLYLMF